MDDKLLKLVVLAGDRSGPFYHDFGVPFLYYQQRNLLDPTAIDWLHTDLLNQADIVVFQRQYAVESMLVQRQLKRKGITTIFQCDDNVWEIPPGNPAKETYKPGGETMQRYEKILSSCHAVTTSTPYLAELCRKLNPNVYIFRNLVEPKIHDFLTPGRDNPNEIRIGWTGTPHHHDDIQIIEPAIAEVFKTMPQVKWIFMGYAPVGKDMLRNNISKWEYYEFVPVDAFYPALANLDFDIGIAPLQENGFNKGKTARKAQEYAILEIPMILSPTVNYREWVHGETCLKPNGNTAESWYKSIDRMIKHPEDRRRMAKNAYEQVLRNHSIDLWIEERANIYKEIHQRVQTGDIK